MFFDCHCSLLLILHLCNQIPTYSGIGDGGLPATDCFEQTIGDAQTAAHIGILGPRHQAHQQIWQDQQMFTTNGVSNVLFIEEINGTPAILSWSDGHLNWVQTLNIRDNDIVGLHTLVNPDKLVFLQRQLESRPEPFLSSSPVLP